MSCRNESAKHLLRRKKNVMNLVREEEIVEQAEDF